MIAVTLELTSNPEFLISFFDGPATSSRAGLLSDNQRPRANGDELMISAMFAHLINV